MFVDSNIYRVEDINSFRGEPFAEKREPKRRVSILLLHQEGYYSITVFIKLCFYSKWV